jgi:hypothetical protein
MGRTHRDASALFLFFVYRRGRNAQPTLLPLRMGVAMVRVGRMGVFVHQRYVTMQVRVRFSY